MRGYASVYACVRVSACVYRGCLCVCMHVLACMRVCVYVSPQMSGREGAQEETDGSRLSRRGFAYLYSAPQPLTKLMRMVHMRVSWYTDSNPWLTDWASNAANSWLLKIFRLQPAKQSRHRLVQSCQPFSRLKRSKIRF